MRRLTLERRCAMFRVVRLGLILFGLPWCLTAQDSRLFNLSVRAQAGGGDPLITGFTIGPGARKTVLVRAVGPMLGFFGVSGALTDPKLALYDSSGAKLAENDDFRPEDSATFAAAGAFELAPGGKDAALVATLGPGGYTVEVTGVGDAAGATLVEVYEVESGGNRLINLSARAKVGAGEASLIPGITISAGSGSRRLLLRAIGPKLRDYGVLEAIDDPRLELFSGSVRIAGNDDWELQTGNASGNALQLAAAFAQAGAFPLDGGAKDAALIVNLGPGSYTLQVSGSDGATGQALVEAYDITPANTGPVSPSSRLFFAQIRPSGEAPGSLASGFAAISFSSADSAKISINISNLSSAQTNAYVRLAGTDSYLFRLPLGQVADRTWSIGPVGIYSRDDILRALNEGRLYVSVETAKHPAGEARGVFIPASGSIAFTPPASPPALPGAMLNSPGDIDAARLLMQATFGPTEDSIAELKRLGVRPWIQAQMALPPTSFLALARQDATDFRGPLMASTLTRTPLIAYYGRIRHVWFKLVATAPDQLRQRVAFALSELFVIASDTNDQAESGLAFYDVLVRHAFGNFRALLEQVSLHPMMGWYLTYLRNQKADPVKGATPDENYAREIQQLFTIGLVQLQPDGTLLLDAEGRPIPTYDNITIAETAKVFTGWAYKNSRNNFFTDPGFSDPDGFDFDRFYGDANGRMVSMVNYEAYHDTSEKRIISLQQLPPREAPPTVIPAGTSGPAELKILLDTLCNHPNTPPFVCRQLIQRLVTSNPSPGYVYRVAEVFRNNGLGVRGDLAAVVTAILTDYEARAPEAAASNGFGKVKEPLVRLTGLMRVLKTGAPNGRFSDDFIYYTDQDINRVGALSSGSVRSLTNSAQTLFGQQVFSAPSVFNFFSPGYTIPGPLGDAGLVAPEMQITDSYFAVKAPNSLTTLIDAAPPKPANEPSPSPFLRNDFSSFLSLSADAEALVSRVDLLLCAGGMDQAARKIVKDAVAGIALPKPITNYPSARQFAFAPASSAQWLAAPRGSAFDPGSAFTMEGWLLRTGTTNSFIFGKRGDTDIPGTSGLCNLLIGTDGRLSFEMHGGLPNTSVFLRSDTFTRLGEWVHVAIVFDGAAVALYVDGVKEKTATVRFVPAADANVAFSIGVGLKSNGGAVYGPFPGCVSQIRFWRVARSNEQIVRGMSEGVPLDAAGLVANWLLDEGRDGIARDSSGNGYHLAGANPSGSVGWLETNGVSLDRVKTALHVTTVIPASAVQR